MQELKGMKELCFHHALLKKAILLHKRAAVRFDMNTAVNSFPRGLGIHTHMDISQGPIALLWSKMAFFKRVWRKVKVVSRPSPWWFHLHID